MTVYARGIDYAWTHPNPKAIKDAGFDFVVRYYSRDPTKNLTRAEADALAAEGLWIVGNWEHGAQDALGGGKAGTANAVLARSLADACGQPRDRPIYESDDWDVAPAQEPVITSYLRAWDAVIGLSQVGEYAGFYPLKAQRDAGVTSWEWQPRAWSGGQWEARVNIRQTGSATVGGVQVDVNEAWTPDYGQWMPGVSPAVKGVVVEQSDALQGNLALPGRRVGDVFADESNFRDWWYGQLGVADGNNPPGNQSRAAQLVLGVIDIQKRLSVLAVPDAGAIVAALVADADAIARLAAAIAALLPQSVTADQIAVAVAKHLGADLAGG